MSTTTLLTELIYAEWISPFIGAYAQHFNNPSQFFARHDPQNGSNVVSVPRVISDQGTPGDAGVAVDTELNFAEATELTPIDYETEDSTFTINRYGVMREISDQVLYQTINANELINNILVDGASMLMAAANSDASAAFSGFTNTSGATTVDLVLADVDDAIYDLSDRGAPSELVGVLSLEQSRHFMTALTASNSSQATFAGAADRIMGVTASADGGRNAEGYLVTYKGVPFHKGSLCVTATAGTDWLGAVFVRGDVATQVRQAGMSQGSLRGFEAKTQENISKGTTEIVMSMTWGGGVTQPLMGQKLITNKA